MNPQLPPFNQSVPMLNHTDWASMAKQWATLRANVNIPQTVNKVENYTYHNLPPPPPPPPITSIQNSNAMPFNNNYQSVVNHEDPNSFIRASPVVSSESNNNSVYEPPMYSIYEEVLPANVNSQRETFDYNHRDRPYVNFNNTNPYRPPPTTNTFNQSIFNLPPPTHQDYIETHYPKPVQVIPDPAPPKLFPIVNSDDYHVTKPSLLPNSLVQVHGGNNLPYATNKFHNQTEFTVARSNKGLPAWIIDDMKKIKEKERKPAFTSVDDYRDHPVNSKRDEEGDIVMEDVIKESEIDSMISGKSVITTNRIDNSTTEIDIDDVNLNDEDDGFDKIDYSSKSLVDLIEMLDENELENLKMLIIRDSLTGVMKEVTDDLISEAVNSTFTKELCKVNMKTKVKGVSRDSKTVNCISEATVKPIDPPAANIQPEIVGYLLGLDVYESDDEKVENIEVVNENPVKTTTNTESRERWSSHKKSSDLKVDKKSSVSKDNHKSHSREKKISSSDTNSTKNSPSKRKHKSKSRDRSHKSSKSHDRNRSPGNRRRSRSKDRNGESSSSHKKSKKHNNSPSDSRDHKWKNDKCDKSNPSGKKRSRRDRSRS